MESFEPILAGDLRKIFAIFRGGRLAHPLDLVPGCESQRIRVQSPIFRLPDDIGMGVQALEQNSLIDLPRVVHLVEQPMMPKRRPALVHDLSLALWVEVLRD